MTGMAGIRQRPQLKHPQLRKPLLLSRKAVDGCVIPAKAGIQKNFFRIV
jgi:hypothetical protein